MNISRSPVSTAIAALPVKLVRYVTLGSAVTTSAASDRSSRICRMRAWRRSRLAVGAWDIDGVEPPFERGDRALGANARGLGRLIVLGDGNLVRLGRAHGARRLSDADAGERVRRSRHRDRNARRRGDG